MRRIFEPFFTTKTDTGTGLGLWVVAQLVERHKGRVKVWSSQRPGASGTVFSVFLPIGDAAEGEGFTNDSATWEQRSRRARLGRIAETLSPWPLRRTESSQRISSTNEKARQSSWRALVCVLLPSGYRCFTIARIASPRSTGRRALIRSRPVARCIGNNPRS